jgi:hypothetical protein
MVWLRSVQVRCRLSPFSGARSRKTCRREAPSTTTLICGPMTARWNESTTRSITMSRTRAAGSQPDRRHHRQPEREKRRKRGRPLIRTGTMRARRSKARSGTFLSNIRSSAPRHRSSGRHSRPRWRSARHGDTVRHVSLLEDAVCRQWILRAEICESACKGSAASRH